MTDTPATDTLIVPHVPVAQRAEEGKALRQRMPRRALGDWSPAPDRDPIGILTAQEERRLQDLVQLRRERMAASPFAFFRGAAAVFSADLAPCPRSDMRVQLCGDAHLANFGGFASPERSLVFDINDFDETLPGPFEWDVKRLAASFEVAARANGFDEPVRQAIQRTLARAYASAMRTFAGMDHLDVWYLRVDADEFIRTKSSEVSPEVIERVRARLQKAKSKDRMKALRRLTVSDGGELRFASDPPVLQPISELMDGSQTNQLFGVIHHALRNYRRSLQPDRRYLLEQYRFADLARKVVGVGSVGTRCWVALLLGRESGDPLFLQIKEAERSVMEPYLGRSMYEQQGRRVVEGQRMQQSASDIFLGWERVRMLDGTTRDHYFRQLWDWKVSAAIETMDVELLTHYSELCAYTLARAHARSGDSVAISAYLGNGKVLGEGMTEFAALYADQNERDHAEAVARWFDGVVPTPG
ncbi:MAG TPA: DUF2252 domain-containing protein [Acidimicrobiales bacterium]